MLWIFVVFLWNTIFRMVCLFSEEYLFFIYAFFYLINYFILSLINANKEYVKRLCIFVNTLFIIKSYM